MFFILCHFDFRLRSAASLPDVPTSVCRTIDNSLMNNIQKIFSDRIEIFSTVEFSRVSVLTGIIKISLKVSLSCIHIHMYGVVPGLLTQNQSVIDANDWPFEKVCMYILLYRIQ